jgi:hypothetical protein
MSRGTFARPAEGVIQVVGGNHESAAAECDCHLDGVGWKLVSEPSRSRDAAQTAEHHEENRGAAVLAESNQQCNGPKERHQQGQAAVNAFFGGQKVREDCRERKQNRREEAMDNAQG